LTFNYQEKIKQWAEERFISSQVHNKNGYVANVVSEMAEGIQAKNEEEFIDHLCDIIVFTLTENTKNLYDITQEVIPENSYYISSFQFDMIILLSKIIDENSENYPNVWKKTSLEIISYCKAMIEYLSYDFEQCMEETFTEINSRTGAWNEQAQKWLKYTTPEAKSKWYSADYSKCKIVV